MRRTALKVIYLRLSTELEIFVHAEGFGEQRGFCDRNKNRQCIQLLFRLTGFCNYASISIISSLFGPLLNKPTFTPTLSSIYLM